MAKRYDDPIDVTADPQVRGPVSFSWRGRRYEIDEQLSSWRDGGEWWDRTRAREREYFRVLARPAGMFASGEIDSDGFLVSPAAVYDIYFDRLRSAWRMARLWD